MRKATQQQTKEHNRNLVLKMIFDRETISRAEIARITSLTRTTVSDLVADLLEEGLISEIGVGPSQVGKSPILLSLVEDSRYVIGLNLAQDQFCGAVVNLRGKIQKMVVLPVNDRSGEEALASVYEILDQLIDANYTPVVGIGVGTPGLVNTREGIVVNAVNLDWEDLPLARLLEDRHGLPVQVLNDSQAAAVGAYTYCNSRTADSNLVVINAHQGIGAGIMINGRLFPGDGGGAGEIGHIVVAPDSGLICRCGKRGCLETVASAQSLVKRAQSLVSQAASTQLPSSTQEINLDAIERAFASGDPLVQQIVLETAHWMGRMISSLVGTLNIHRIVLTGDMTRFGQPWLSAIQATVAQNTLQKLAQDTRVEIGNLGRDNVILGASALLANNYSLLFKKRAGLPVERLLDEKGKI